SGVSGATSYSWGIVSGPGSLTGGPGNTITYNYPSVGNTVVTVAGVNGSCIGNIFSQTLTVSSLPSGGSLNPLGTTLCPNSSITMTLSGMSNFTSVNWGSVLGTPTVVGSGLTATINYSTGDFQITVIGFNGNCVANSAIGYNYFNVNPVPSPPTSGSPNSRCGSGSVTIGAAGGSTSNYNWYLSSVGGALQGNSGNLFNTPTISTTTSFFAASVDNIGCESTRLRVVASVTGGAIAPTVISVNKCVGQTLTPLSSNGTNLKWYSDAGLSNLVASGVSTYFPPGVTNTVAGSYTYFVTQTNGGCQSSPAAASFNVNDTTQVAILGLPTAICSNGLSSFTIAGFPSGGYFPPAPLNNFTYTSTVAGSRAIINPVAIPGTLSTLTISYFYVNANGCTSRAVQNLQKVTPAVVTSFNPAAGTKIVQGNYGVNLSAPSLSNTIFYGPGSLVSNNQLVPLQSIPVGIYTLTATGNDVNGCGTQGTVNYEIISQPNDLFGVTNGGGNITALGTSFCQGLPPFNIYFDLSNSVINIADQNTSNVTPTQFLYAVSVSGGVPDPVYPTAAVNSLSYISYDGFSGNPLVTTYGLITVGGVRFVTVPGLATISSKRYVVGQLNPNQPITSPITFSYKENVPNYVWQPDRLYNKFGQDIGPSQTNGKFVYTGTSVNTRQFTSPPIAVNQNGVPSFTLPTKPFNCINTANPFPMNPSGPGLSFTWVSNSGLGPNQPIGLISTVSGLLFNPSVNGIKSGFYTITGSVSQGGSCSNSYTQVVEIVDTTNVSFITVGGNQFGLGIPGSYCKDNQAYPLSNYVTVPGGSFTGPYSFYGQGVDGVSGTVSYGNVKSGNNFIGVVYTNTVTGCTTNKRINISIDSTAFLKLPAIPPSCAGLPILLQGTVGGVGTGFLSATHSWTGPGTGTFTPSTVSGGVVRAYYTPSGTDTTSKIAYVTLQTANTGNSCPSIQSTTSVNLHANVQIYTQNPVQVCASDPIILTSTLLGSAIDGTWSIGGVNTLSKYLVSTVDAITLNATAAQLFTGGSIGPVRLTSSPYQPGGSACSPKAANVTVNVDQVPKVNLSYFLKNGQSGSGNGLLANSCSLDAVSVVGVVSGGRLNGIPFTESLTGTWFTSGSGVFKSTGTNTSTALIDAYLPSSGDTSLSQITLYFTSGINALSSCKPAKDSIRIQFYRPLQAIASVLNPNICGSNTNNIQLRGQIRGGGVTGTVNSINYAVFNRWFKVLDPGIEPETDPQYLSGKNAINTDYNPTPKEDTSGATIRFQMWTQKDNYCPADTDIVTAYISQPARIIINRNVKDTSYCADPNGILKLRAQLAGSTPYASWSAPGGRVITPNTIIASVTGLYNNVTSTYTPTPLELKSQTFIKFALTSGKPVASPPGSPLGTPNVCPIVSDTQSITIKILPVVSIGKLKPSYCNIPGFSEDLVLYPPLNTPGVLPARFTTSTVGVNTNSGSFSPNEALKALFTLSGVSGTLSG
ncbi:MAG: hypothetical protein K2Q22_11660, partial [Cytophagales bacterium]|nr:hypothetical protein [Cytophagales bacterium]